MNKRQNSEDRRQNDAENVSRKKLLSKKGPMPIITSKPGRSLSGGSGRANR
jgi:hypothetical protein